MAEDKKLAEIKQIAAKLLKQLDLPVTARVELKEENNFTVQLETDNPGLLIGYHGETLAAFQLILNKVVYRQTGEWLRIVVNVGDYRERRSESLERMALSAAQKVKFSGEEYSFSPMSPAERRIIHLTLADHPDVVTESTGEGRDRRVVVKLKTS
jgi:spoIIIJ-associated protein